MRLDEILRPSDVSLQLRARDKPSAIEEVLGQVRGDVRVHHWEKLRAAVLQRDAPAIAEDGRGICIAHGRTDAVSELVVAVGRSPDGIVFPELAAPVCLVFVAGIPAAMDSEYLRIVGAIARVCRAPQLFDDLLTAPDGDGFVEVLAAATERL